MDRKVSIILPYYDRKDFLKRTLDSFQHFYKENPGLEIVIVDDCSGVHHRIESLVEQYDLNVLLIRIPEKNGTNPCYPYNVGVRKSSGEIIVLSSPEIFHTTDMFRVTNNFEKLTDKTYFQFSVFCSSKDVTNVDKKKFCKNLGETGCSFANRWGTWYSHSKIKPSCLNFFSALTRNNYYKLSGFDERFRHGLGYDDDEFKVRVLEIVDEVIWFDESVAIHVNHPMANDLTLRRNMKLFKRNMKLFKRIQENTYKPNDNWGRLL